MVLWETGTACKWERLSEVAELMDKACVGEFSDMKSG